MSLDDQINKWISDAGRVLANAKIMLTVVYLPSEAVYERFFARTAAAGITVIVARPGACPADFHVLAMKSADEMKFCAFSLDASDMTPAGFFAEIRIAEQKMPRERPLSMNLSVESRNVTAMEAQIVAVAAVYGDRFKASRVPATSDDTREVTWLMSIANEAQHRNVTSRFRFKQMQARDPAANQAPAAPAPGIAPHELAASGDPPAPAPFAPKAEPAAVKSEPLP